MSSGPDILAHRLQEPAGEVSNENRRVEDGEPKTVLLLNGGMMTYPSWATVTEALLTAGFSVLGCDFRGQLLSPPTAEQPVPETIEGHVPAVIGLLDHLDLERVHVLGTSYGAMVGLALAAGFPERTASLAVATSVHRTPPGMAEDSERMQGLVRQVLGGGSTEPFHGALLQDFYSPEYRDRHRESIAHRARQVAALPEAWFAGLLGILGSLKDFDLTDLLPHIQAPVTVMHAAKDEIMPLDLVQELVTALDRPGRACTLHVHAASGHALVVEDPAWLAATYLEFVTALNR